MFYRRACIYLLVRFPIPHSPHAYYFRAEKETTELRCAIKIIPPTSSSFLPSPFRCRPWGAGKAIYMSKQLVAIMLPSCSNHDGRCLSVLILVQFRWIKVINEY